MDEFKKCPFCGGTKIFYRELKSSVFCMDCEARGPVRDTREESVMAWNERGDSHKCGVRCEVKQEEKKVVRRLSTRW